MNNGAVQIVVPANWSAPSTSGSTAGYTTSTAGTVAASGQTITVSGVTLSSGATVTVVYGRPERRPRRDRPDRGPVRPRRLGPAASSRPRAAR